MQRGGAQHEVAAYVARLRAVEQRPDELGVGVVSAPLEAVLDGGYAAVMAVRAVGDAFAHRVVEVLGGGQVVGHAEKGSCRARGGCSIGEYERRRAGADMLALGWRSSTFATRHRIQPASTGTAVTVSTTTQNGGYHVRTRVGPCPL